MTKMCDERSVLRKNKNKTPKQFCVTQLDVFITKSLITIILKLDLL